MRTPAILSVFGPSGSGKTTWLSEVVMQLDRLGVRCGAVKVCHHAAQIEPLHKDSSRLLAAGADQVLLLAPGKKAILRQRPDSEDERAQERALEQEIVEFARDSDFDVILVEGARRSSFSKVALNITGVNWNLGAPFPLLARAGIPSGGESANDWTNYAIAARGIKDWVQLRKDAAGVSGIILAGGHGTRLGGMDKGALILEGMTLLERSTRLLRTCLSRIAVATPRPWEMEGAELERARVEIISDVPGLAGPMGGVLAGLRESETGIVVVGVDQFAISGGSVARLLDEGLRSGAAVLAPGGIPQWNIMFLSRGKLEAIENAAASGARSLKACCLAAEASHVECSQDEAADVDVPADFQSHGIAKRVS